MSFGGPRRGRILARHRRAGQVKRLRTSRHATRRQRPKPGSRFGARGTSGTHDRRQARGTRHAGPDSSGATCSTQVDHKQRVKHNLCRGGVRRRERRTASLSSLRARSSTSSMTGHECGAKGPSPDATTRIRLGPTSFAPRSTRVARERAARNQGAQTKRSVRPPATRRVSILVSCSRFCR